MEPTLSRPVLGNLTYTYDAHQHRNGVTGQYLGQPVEIRDGHGHLGDLPVDLKEDFYASTGKENPFTGHLGGQPIQGVRSQRWLPSEPWEPNGTAPPGGSRIKTVEHTLHELRAPGQDLEVDFQVKEWHGAPDLAPEETRLLGGSADGWQVAQVSSSVSKVRSLSGDKVDFEIQGLPQNRLQIVGEPPTDRGVMATVLTLLPNWDS